VLPKLEVGMPPHILKDRKDLEDVQRRATKVISGVRELSYPARMSKMNLPILVYRRNTGGSPCTIPNCWYQLTN